MKTMCKSFLWEVRNLFIRRWSHLAVGLCSVCLFVTCGCNRYRLNEAGGYATAINGSVVKKGVKPETDSEAAVIETEYGRIVIELYPNVAPRTVERFKKLVAETFYDGTAIHRIDPELGIVQGGGANSKDLGPTNDGAGSSPYPNLPAEFSDLPFEKGTVGAARGTSPNSANCQFFISLKRQPAFDQRYTVFGRVVEGIGIAGVISAAPVTEGTDRPADRITVKRVTLAPRANFAPGESISDRQPAATHGPDYVEAARRALAEGREAEAREYIKAIREDPGMVDVRAASASMLAAKIGKSQGVATGEDNSTLEIRNPVFSKAGAKGAANFLLEQGNVATDLKLFGFRRVVFTDASKQILEYDLDKRK